MDDKSKNTARVLYMSILVLSLVCIGLGYSVYEDYQENGYVSIDDAKEYNSNGGYPNTTAMMEEFIKEARSTTPVSSIKVIDYSDGSYKIIEGAVLD